MSIEISPGRLRDDATIREPMSGDGASGATLERLTFEDGSRLVVKSFAPGRDWMMRATHDTGRAAELWTSGAADRLPPTIDPAIVRIEHEGDEWRLYLKDVSALFLRRGTVVDAAELRRFLDAAAAMHRAYWLDSPTGLATLEELILLASPETIAREDTADSPFLTIVDEGWRRFDELAPRDVGAAVRLILDDPRPLAAALRANGTTLVHADLHYGNVAPAEDRFVVIDWGLATAAPPAVDFAWYLDQGRGILGPSREEAIAAFVAAEGDLHDPATLDLALLAELVLAGWQYGDATVGPDDVRARRRADLAWWVGRARIGLDRLG